RTRAVFCTYRVVSMHGKTNLRKHVILYNSGLELQFSEHMVFKSSHYGADVARILAYGEDGNRLAPLVCGPCVSEDARRELARFQPRDLFPDHKDPAAPMAGLWLYFSCFEEAHRLIDHPRTPDGVYWHAILHRMEPDDGNAAYWFRK